MKIRILTIILVFASINLLAQLDRSIQPTPGPAPEIMLGDYESFELTNGLKVFVIENNKLPVVNFSLLTVRDPIMEDDQAGYIDIAGELIRRGTKNRTKEEIDEQIDFIGARLSTSGQGISGSSLKKHFPTLMEIFSDVLLNSEFKQDELDKIKTQMISGLAAGKEDPGTIASNLRTAQLYGSGHPYGELSTEKTVEAITLEKCQSYYNDNFRPNISLLAFVGDITIDEAKDMVEKLLGDWEKKEVSKFTYDEPKQPLVRKVAISDRSASVQSVINVAYTIDLKKDSEDVLKVSVLNTILGGAFSSRLNQNLREDHGYTYGAGSSMRSDRLVGSFTASATVRNSVTDSSITEIFNEMKKLRSEKVGEVELSRIKNFITGSFSRSLENAGTIARFALNIEINKLPKDFYKNYLKNLNSVTAEDVQAMAKKYLTPDRSYVLVVGNAEEVAPSLRKFSTSGKISYHDNYGVEYDPNLRKVEDGITVESIIENYINAIGGREKLEKIVDKVMELKGAVQGMDMKLTIAQKTPNKLFQELDFSAGKQITIFDGENGKVEGMGQVQMLEGEQLEDLKFQASLNAYLDYPANGIKLKLAGLETINEEEAYKIVLTTPSGKNITHFYAKESGLKIREVSELTMPQGTFTQTIDLSDYQEVDGYKFPYKLTQTMGPQSLNLEVTSVKINSGLEEEMFEIK